MCDGEMTCQNVKFTLIFFYHEQLKLWFIYPVSKQNFIYWYLCVLIDFMDHWKLLKRRSTRKS